MSIIVQDLSKYYRIHEKEAGFKGTLKNLLHREYFEKKAVDHISFAINKGEIVGLLGENGAGKTTTLKMLAGILYPTSGTVRIEGYIPYQRKKAFLKKISFVMGNKNNINWDLPAIDSFRYQQLIYDVPEKEYQNNLKRLTESLNITHLLKVPVRRLSLGERMKMELVNNFLYSPEVVFLDEPTIGLDLNSQMTIRKFIKAYRDEKKATIIITSHYMDDIEETCDRLILLDHGHKIFDGSIGKLKKPDMQLKDSFLAILKREN